MPNLKRNENRLLKDSETVNLILGYIVLFFVPVITAMVLGVIFQLSHILTFANTLCFPEILFNGLSACTFYYYISRSKCLALKNGYLRFLFSYAYGFSSYLLLQESSLYVLASYALLPVLYLYFEKFLFNGISIGFVLSLSLCLMVDTTTACVTAIFLGVIFLFEYQSDSLGRFLTGFFHYLALVFWSLMISGFISVPTLQGYFSILASSQYPGFKVIYPSLTFASRFLFGSVSHLMLGIGSGIDLYIGIFILFGVILYLINGTINKSEKIKNVICLFILFLCIDLSPLRYIVELMTPTEPDTIYYSFIPLFFLLRMGIKGIATANTLSRKRCHIAIFSMLLFTTILFCGTAHSFHTFSIIANYVLIATYGAFLLYYCNEKKEHTQTLFITILAIGMFELILQAFICTNWKMVPMSADESVQYVWDKTSLPNNGIIFNPQYGLFEEEYMEFNGTYNAHSYSNIIQKLTNCVSLTQEERFTHNHYALLSYDEEINLLCEKIGAKGALLYPISDMGISFPASDMYQITDLGHSLYNLFPNISYLEASTPYLPYEITIPQARSALLVEDSTQACYLIPAEDHADTIKCYYTFPFLVQSSYNFSITGYYVDEDILEDLPKLIDTYVKAEQANRTINMAPLYAGIVCTAIGVLLLLVFCMNKDKEQVISVLVKAKEKIADWSFWCKLSVHIKNNYVYYLALLLPFLAFISVLVYYSCQPFGPYSILDQDGTVSVFAAVMDTYYNLRDGNLILNMNTGYATGYFPFNVFYLPLTLLQPSQVAPAIILLEGILLSFASFNVIFYLTHRSSGTKADKRDYRLLIPALIYALNTYMLAMHSYIDWYPSFMVLPLIFLAMDQLIYHRKWLMYVLLLSLVMYTSIQMAFYMCIALFCLFFTYHFDSVKDFFKKGIRFGLCSILAAGNAFISVAGTFLYATGGTAYATEDSVKPHFAFFGSFLDQWKKTMVFSPSNAVSSNNNDISIYMGVLSILLILAYFTSKQTAKNKIKHILFMGLLLFSFNENITAYVINGLHYQSNCPNRHVLLFMFLVAILSYDGLIALSGFSQKKVSVLALLSLGFLFICQYMSNGNTALAFYSSILLIVIYYICYIIYCQMKINFNQFNKIILFVLAVELIANMFYTTSSYHLTDIMYLGNYTNQNKYNNEVLGLKDSLYRASAPAGSNYNYGSYTNTPNATRFSPSISDSQKNLAIMHGYYQGANFTMANYNSTLMGNALAGNKYILVRKTTNISLTDLSEYRYLGQLNDMYIFENPYVLPLGVYTPKDIETLCDDTDTIFTYYNKFAALYCDEDTHPLFQIGRMNYDVNSNNCTCTFTNTENQLLDMDGVMDGILETAANTGKYFPVLGVHMNLKLIPQIDGQIYLYNKEFISLGNGIAGEVFQTNICYPNPSDPYGTMWASFNKGTFEQFYNGITENCFENIVVKDNHITGTTNYEKDGYTMFSLPYDVNWKAYVDGKEVKIISPENSCLYVETPAGEHSLELIYYVHDTTKILIFITLACLTFTFLFYCIYAKICLIKQREE